jgi:hypothetical protein
MEDKIINNEKDQSIIPPNVEITQESKALVFLKQFLIYLGCALLLSFVSGLFYPNTLPDKSEFFNIMLKVCNGLSIGGVLMICWAGWGLAYNLGSLALATYSIKKTWQVVTNRGKGDLGEKKLGRYDEYLAGRKKKRDLLPRFLGGLVPVILSLVVYFIWLR